MAASKSEVHLPQDESGKECRNTEVVVRQSKRQNETAIFKNSDPNGSINAMDLEICPSLSDISMAIPTDIALLHIETDLLLDRLRASGISPKLLDDWDKRLSPTSCNTSSTYTSCDLDDDGAMSVYSDDDGMRGELQKLGIATSELSHLITNDASRSDVVRESECSEIKSESDLPPERLNEQEAIINLKNTDEKANIAETKDSFSQLLENLLDEIIMVYHDVACHFAESDAGKILLRFPLVQIAVRKFKEQPRETIAHLYVCIFFLTMIKRIVQLLWKY